MLKKWIAQRLLGRNDETLDPIPEDESLDGLNLKQVLEAHDAWKERLQEYIDGRTEETIDPAVAASDKQCTLGKWLHGPGKRFRRHPEYARAVQAHADFHACAAEVVIEKQSGNPQRARELLKTRFRHASSDNQLELVRLFSVVRH